MTPQEICLGDTITFIEQVDNAYHRTSYSIYVTAKAAGKTKTGRLILSPCSLCRNDPHNPRRIKRSTRKHTDRLFEPFAALTVKPQAVRGELLFCSPKSTHPDALKLRDMKTAIKSRRHIGGKCNNFTQHSDTVVRCSHDSEVQIREQEAVLV